MNVFFFLQICEWLCLNCQKQKALKENKSQIPQAKIDNVSTLALSPSNITTKTATETCETNTKGLAQVPALYKDVPTADHSKAYNQTPVQNDNISKTDTDTSQVKDALNIMLVKKVQEKETLADIKDRAPAKGTLPSEATAIMEDQKAVSQIPRTEQEPTGKPTDSNSEIISVMRQPEQLQSAPELDIVKRESGFLEFGFGSTKSKSTSSKPDDTSTGKLFGFGGLTASSPQSAPSVSGKVLGFGSSIFNSASNLISSAVHDESSTTPPTSRKGSTVSQASLKSPLTSRKSSDTSQSFFKTSPTKPFDSQKLDEQAADEKLNVKLDGASSKPVTPHDSQHIGKTPDEKSEVKSSAPLKSVSKLAQSSCPICKVKLDMTSEDLTNFNTCIECNNIVCSQCGFDLMPNKTQVRKKITVRRAHEHFERIILF